MDTENVVYTYIHTHTHNGILAIKTNEIVLFAAIRMDPKIIIASDVWQRKTACVWNLKKKGYP